MMGARLAVIVPLYNGAGFIGDALDSLAAQTVPLSEVIVVNDGSDDDGPEIVRRHGFRPRLIEQPHSGVAAARNRGAFAAEARYIAFLDQDDLWLPFRHERILAFLDVNTSCRALVTNEQSFYLAGDRVGLEARDEPLHRSADHPNVRDLRTLLTEATPPDGPPIVTKSIDTRDLLRGPIATTTSYVFDRESFFVAGAAPVLGRSMDDYWTLVNVSRFTEIPLLDEPSVLRRIHPSSASISTSWPMPLLTWLAAARFGGNLISNGRERDPEHVEPLGLFWQHQLLALARSGRQGLLDALALTQLLAATHDERASLILRLTKSAMTTRLADHVVAWRSRMSRGAARLPL